MRSVMSATCTSGEPVSFSCRLYFCTSSVFFSATIAIEPAPFLGDPSPPRGRRRAPQGPSTEDQVRVLRHPGAPVNAIEGLRFVFLRPPRREHAHRAQCPPGVGGTD